MPKPFGVAIIGTGGISQKHVPGWEASPHAEVIAGSDVNEEGLKTWGAQHGVRKLSSRVEDILADPDVDIVDICTPNRYHAPLITAALEAGKHVICEKPLAPTPGEIKELIAARDASGKELMTAQHFRFKRVSQAVKDEIDSGALGDVYHARGWMLRRNAFAPTPTFIHKAHSGGGACIDIGVHILDLTLWMMGNPKPVTVSGTARTELALKEGQFSVWRRGAEVPKSWDVEEFANAFVRFDNGATLMLEVSWLLHHDTAGEDMQMWLYGTEGGCHWPTAEFLSSNLKTQRLSKRVLQDTDDLMEPHARECFEFAAALAEGRPSPVPPEQSLQVMNILDGIYRSQAEGKEVRV